MIATSPSAPAAIIFFFSFGLFGSETFITSSMPRALLPDVENMSPCPCANSRAQSCRRSPDDLLVLDRINDQELAARFDIAHEMPHVLIRTFNGNADGNSRIDALPFRVSLLFGR